MKKLISLLLAIVFCLGLAACGGTGNADHDYILSLLEKGEYDMAIHVIEGLRDISGGAQQSVQNGQENQNQDQFIELAPDTNGTDWIFHMDLINYTDKTITLEAVLAKDYLDGQEANTQAFEGEDLNILPMGKLVLEPGSGVGWDDMRPVDYGFDGREYLHIFRDEQGQQLTISYMFDMRGMVPAGPGDPSLEQPSGDWQFPMMLENTGDTAWALCAMEITNLRDGEEVDTIIFEGADLSNIGMGGMKLAAGEQLPWSDGHPAVPDWNGREYRFHFMDENDQKQTLSFRFDDLDKQNRLTDYSQDPGKDLKNLRHEASFELEVAPGVFWVPVVSLGASRYSNMDIHSMLDSAPEEKQRSISSLYEALQLYQVGNFTPSDDNIRISENGINWEHHKPGYHAVRTNTGCCATDTNWLRYILDGDYEEVGFMATSQRDGSGHVYNYIFHEGWYYFVDLTHYRASGGPVDNAPENGDLNSYRTTDYVLGNLHKTTDPKAYVDYVQSSFGDPPGLMFMYTAENVLAVDSASDMSGVNIIYEEANGQKITVVFDDPTDNLGFARAESPKNLPDWATAPEAGFPS